jgi:NADPH:quinone reductase-like Zn-dependent oxidoreductase
MSTQMMKAVQINRYGGPEVLSVNEVPVPQLRPGYVLVKVHAVGINPVDWKIREGYLDEMLNHSLPLTLGWDVAGEIVDVADDVNDWNTGDRIYSRPDIGSNGGQAEYILIRADEVASMPKSLDWEQAAAVPLAALTAWQVLVDTAGIKAGDRVLIHAASGSVGGFAVQLAKIYGAHVTATTSSRNLQYVKSLGADEVIDYTSQNFTDLRDMDIIFDTLGGEVLANSWQLLRKGGILVSIVDTPDETIAEQLAVKSAFVFVQPNQRQLNKLAQYIDEGKIKIHLDAVLGLEDIVKAHELSESGRTRGKIVLSVH